MALRAVAGAGVGVALPVVVVLVGLGLVGHVLPPEVVGRCGRLSDGGGPPVDGEPPFDGDPPFALQQATLITWINTVVALLLFLSFRRSGRLFLCTC